MSDLEVTQENLPATGMQRYIQPFMALPKSRRMAIIGVVALSLAAFGVLIFASNRTEYKPLFSNLASEDAGEIVKKLKEQKVQYKLSDDGKAILVPADKVYDLRLSLASEGALPQGGGIGFEIFDRKNFGMTEFVQKLNYQRALQGELARTIMQIAGIEHARVHLAIPEKSLFKENEKQPTASVVLKVKGSRVLRENDVQGIVQLVSSSVEGMNPDQVTVLDQKGKILSRNPGGDGNAKVSSTMMEAQRSYEKNVEERLQSLLEKAVGSNKSVSRVSALLDFKQVEKTEERYDPDATAVRSEQRTEQREGGSSTAPSGVPGVQANLGRTTAGAGSTSGGAAKTDETLNYEVSKTSAHIIEPVGTLSKLSVAIMVDGRYEPVAGAKKNEAQKMKYVPRSPEELQKIEALVKSAVGFNAERGDQVTVVNVPFQETDEAEKVEWWQQPQVVEIGKNALIGIGFLIFMLMVVRPLMKRALPKPEKVDNLAGEEEQHLLPETDEIPLLESKVNHAQIMELVKNEPYQTAQIIQAWLKQKE